MAGLSYGLVTGVPLVALAIYCGFVLQRRCMVRADLVAIAVVRLLRKRDHASAVELCLRTASAPAAQLALCLLAVRLPRRASDAPSLRDRSGDSFATALSAVRASLVRAVQAEQRQPTWLGVVSGLTGALAASSATLDHASTRNGPVVLAAAGLLAAGFVWQRWRTLHQGIALVGEAVSGHLVPEEELDSEGRAAVTRAAERCHAELPALAALLEPSGGDGPPPRNGAGNADTERQP